MNKYDIWCKQKEIVKSIVNEQWDYWLKQYGYDPEMNVCELSNEIYQNICYNINKEVKPLFLPPFNFPKERNGFSIGWNYKEQS